MPFARMDAALDEATKETSTPEAFVLSHDDFGVFVDLAHPSKEASPFLGKLADGDTSPAEWKYRSHPVTKAEHPEAVSRLHVLRADGALSNPITLL